MSSPEKIVSHTPTLPCPYELKPALNTQKELPHPNLTDEIIEQWCKQAPDQLRYLLSLAINTVPSSTEAESKETKELAEFKTKALLAAACFAATNSIELQPLTANEVAVLISSLLESRPYDPNTSPVLIKYRAGIRTTYLSIHFKHLLRVINQHNPESAQGSIKDISETRKRLEHVARQLLLLQLIQSKV